MPVKYDFQHIFDRDEFEGRVVMSQKFDNGSVKRNKDVTPMTETYVIKKGTVNSEFIEAHNLTSYSHPAEVIALFLPLNENPYSTEKNPLPTFQLLVKWTNLKANLVDAGTDVSCYQDYKPFSALDLLQHMGLNIQWIISFTKG